MLAKVSFTFGSPKARDLADFRAHDTIQNLTINMKSDLDPIKHFFYTFVVYEYSIYKVYQLFASNYKLPIN